MRKSAVAPTTSRNTPMSNRNALGRCKGPINGTSRCATCDVRKGRAKSHAPAPVIAAIALRYAYKTDSGHLAIDRFLLRVPVFGQLIRKSAVARFTRTLGTLVSSGVPILDALTITAPTALE